MYHFIWNHQTSSELDTSDQEDASKQTKMCDVLHYTQMSLLFVVLVLGRTTATNGGKLCIMQPLWRKYVSCVLCSFEYILVRKEHPFWLGVVENDSAAYFLHIFTYLMEDFLQTSFIYLLSMSHFSSVMDIPPAAGTVEGFHETIPLTSCLNLGRVLQSGQDSRHPFLHGDG